LLMDNTSLSGSLASARQGLSKLKKYSASQNQSVLDLCLNYADQIDWASSIVVGATTAEQLSEIVNHKKKQIDLESLPDAFPDSITDPRRWTHT
jgi:aryl-alcohol dehydrogenase-like predicted oxidoreductase